jgi:hypothetical protein
VARTTSMSQTWQERRSGGKRGKRDVNNGKRDVNVARPTLSGNMIFFFFKFPLFCDNMDNFVHNAANKTSEFLQYVLVIPKEPENQNVQQQE